METAIPSTTPEPISPTQPEIPSAPPPTPSKHKLPLIVIIVLLIALLSAGGFFLAKYLLKSKTPPPTASLSSPTTATPTPDPTANWKTYKNTKHSYSFKYPPAWEPATCAYEEIGLTTGLNLQQLDNVEFHQLGWDCPATDFPYPYFAIYVRDENLTAPEFFPPVYNGTDRVIEQKPNKQINGKTFFVYWTIKKEPSPALDNQIAYYLKDRGKIYSFNVFNKNDVSVLEQLLSTFKFLDQTDETANWKIYTNTAFNYTLKYPSDWSIAAKGGADVTTFPAPVLNSPCNYESDQLCSQVFIGTSSYDEAHKFDPSFVIDTTGAKPDKVTNKITMSLGGEEAVGFEYFQSNYGDIGRLLYVVVSNHNNFKYTITYEESQKDRPIKTSQDWRNKKQFDQILSTFRFD